jgi:hypothetical protein
LWVRQSNEGVLYWLNEETGGDEILADFRPLSGAFYNTPISAPCDQDAQAQERPVVFEAAGGVFPDAREVRYRVLDCADVGVENELYLDNIGLARRVNQTIAGPREFNLVSAKIGSFTLNAAPGADFRVTLSSAAVNRQRSADPVSVEVGLRLVIDRLNAVHLRYNTSQRYDVAVRNEHGETVFLWSASAIFLQVVSEEDVVDASYKVPLTLDLPDGNYQVEAWLTTDAPQRQFAAVAPFAVFTEGPVPAASRPARARGR